jgi:dTDP-L-rhamnose 4-epimerase
MQEKILITGGLGFIGMALTRRLQALGLSVRIMDSLSPQIHGAAPCINLDSFGPYRPEILRGDISSRRDWQDALVGISAVAHLASQTGTGQSMYRIADYTGVNVSGTAQLLDVLANERHAVKKVMLASSRSVYGEGAYHCHRDGIVYPPARTADALATARWDLACPCCAGPLLALPTPENARTSPVSIYAATKLAQEDLLRITGNALGIPPVILRLQNVYGEGQSLHNPYTGILSIFSNRIRQGKQIYLFEDGRESRDFVHVSDVVEAMALSLTTSGGDGLVLNVGSGQAASVAEVALALKAEFGDPSPAEISGEYRLGDIRHCFADLTAIESTLGFHPAVPFSEGIARFAAWVRSQPIYEDGLDRANRELAERGLMRAQPA